jgi:hypothetical protein
MNQITTDYEINPERIAYAMAEAYELDYRNFALVHGDCTPTVAYAGRIGIYLGNWSQIRGSRSSPVTRGDYLISVDGVEFDTRDGMTENVYKEMVSQDENRNNPDRYVRPIGGGVFFPMTWLTGEKATPHWGPVGHVDTTDAGTKHPKRIGLLRNSSSGAVRFRPAIIIPTVK